MKRTDDVVPAGETQCTVEGCERRRWARGFCPTHYRRWSRYGDPQEIRQPAPRKQCSVDDCAEPHMGRGLCNVHYQQQYRAANPPPKGSHRESTRKHILKQYGLTIADYEGLVRQQRGRCAICPSTSPGTNGHPNYSWLVDHDHTTGKVRGLLCRRCNTAIGLLDDDPAIVSRAFRYIRKHRQSPAP